MSTDGKPPTVDELHAVARRAGVRIDEDETDRMLMGYRGLQELLDRIRTDLPPTVEPAVTFTGPSTRVSR